MVREENDEDILVVKNYETKQSKLKTLKYEDICINIVDDNNKIWAKGSDVCNVLGLKGTDQTIRNLVSDKNKKKFCELYAGKFNRNQKMTIFIDIDGIREILCRTKKMPENIKKISQMFNIDTKIVNIVMSKEQSELDKILKVFKNEKIELQFFVDGFRIDLYFVDYKLAVECDENNHKDRSILYEIKREAVIKEKLKCKFIRFDPDDKDYDSFVIIGLIYDYIKNKIIEN